MLGRRYSPGLMLAPVPRIVDPPLSKSASIKHLRWQRLRNSFQNVCDQVNFATNSNATTSSLIYPVYFLLIYTSFYIQFCDD